MNIASLFKRKMNDPKSNEPVTPNTPNDNSSTMQVNPPDEVVDTSTPIAPSTPVVPSDVESDEKTIPANWIAISKDGEFICSECSNKSAPETNTENGTVTADLVKVKADLTQYPTKIIYGICPVCGMEFTFKNQNGNLYLEPSEMMK